MGLKTVVRSWLGIVDFEEAAKEAEKTRLIEDKATLRQEIADAMQVVLAGEKRSHAYFVWGPYFPDEGLRFQQTVQKITGEQAAQTAQHVVEDRIGGEAFIDELVARVRRKQLGD